MFEADACTETVSIVEALVFGANGACVDIGLGSLLGGIALFVGVIVALRFIGSALLRRVLPSGRASPTAPDPTAEPAATDTLQRMPYESPIRSTGAWGGEKR